MKEKFNYVLEEDNYLHLDQREEKNQFLILQERMVKITLKLATLKISVHLNIQLLKGKHDKDLNAAKDNGTTETIEELDKLYQILEDKKVMLRKLVRN